MWMLRTSHFGESAPACRVGPERLYWNSTMPFMKCGSRLGSGPLCDQSYLSAKDGAHARVACAACSHSALKS
jgi:hypothetical protein